MGRVRRHGASTSMVYAAERFTDARAAREPPLLSIANMGDEGDVVGEVWLYLDDIREIIETLERLDCWLRASGTLP